MPITPSLARLRAELGGYTRRGNVEAAEQARLNLRFAKAEQYIRTLVDQAPPLTDQQRARLAALLDDTTSAGRAA